MFCGCCVLLCFGSRENVAKRVAEGSWEEFGRMVESVPAGNEGYIGFFIDKPEIIPYIPKTGAVAYRLASPQTFTFSMHSHTRTPTHPHALTHSLTHTHTHSLSLSSIYLYPLDSLPHIHSILTHIRR